MLTKLVFVSNLFIYENNFITSQGEEALSAISDIAEAEPKYWKKNFNILF